MELKKRRKWKRWMILGIVVMLAPVMVLVGLGIYAAFIMPAEVERVDLAAALEGVRPAGWNEITGGARTGITHQGSEVRDGYSGEEGKDESEAQLDALIAAAEQYMLDEERLSEDQRDRHLKKIEQDFYNFMSGGSIALEEAFALNHWLALALYESALSKSDWRMAAIRSRAVSDWKISVAAEEVIMSGGSLQALDLLRKSMGQDAWRLEVACWRKLGGAEGYGRIVTGEIERQAETLADWIEPQAPAVARALKGLDLN